MIAPKRSSVAGRMPPIIMSQISVVDTSITPRIRRESMSFSIDLPPMPVAWKTSGSQSFSISLMTCCTHGVVTPNIVMPTSGGGVPAGFWRVLFDPVARHRPHGMRTVAEHRARNAVEALHVGHRVHHRDVGRSDIG